MRLISILLLSNLTILFFCLTARSQVDTVRPGTDLLQTKLLKPGLRQYLVYFQDPKNNMKLGFWLWLRDIVIETHNGRNVFSIAQHWYGPDTSAYRSVYSQNSVDDFAPLFHMERVKGQTRAYNWNARNISGADTVNDNIKKDFYLQFDAPNLNWNLDIETFEMLPLKEGRAFLINFYDAGLDPPKYVLYKVAGSEELLLMSGQRMDCWILVTEGIDAEGHAYSERYWISKETQEFLKEEDHFNGMYRYKIKMPGTAPDLLKNFDKPPLH